MSTLTRAGKGVSLNGRQFRSLISAEGGEVSPETLFEFTQEGDLVYARYAGGSVRMGFLVGTMLEPGHLHFRYAQVNRAGETSTGQSDDRIEVLPDGRLCLHEVWSWDSKSGSGTSTLEEVRRGADA